MEILELVSEELQDRFLGFHLARGFDLREVGLVYYVIASSEQCRCSGERKAILHDMNEGVRLQMRQDDRTVSDHTRLCRYRKAVRPTSNRVLAGNDGTDFPASDGHQVGAASLEDQTSARRKPAEFKNSLGATLNLAQFGDEIILPASVVSLPIVGRDNYLNDLLLQYAEAALADRSKERAVLRSAVEGVLPQLLPTRQGKYVERRQTASHEHANAAASSGKRVWRLRKYWRKQEQPLQRAILPNAVFR